MKKIYLLCIVFASAKVNAMEMPIAPKKSEHTNYESLNLDALNKQNGHKKNIMACFLANNRVAAITKDETLLELNLNNKTAKKITSLAFQKYDKSKQLV